MLEATLRAADGERDGPRRVGAESCQRQLR